MAQLLNRVQPGDVITAEMWNLAVDGINELLLAGQTTGIKVATTSPEGVTDAPIRVGLPLQITGQSFGYSIGQSRVSFEWPGGKVVVFRDQMLAGSSDERLLIITPQLPGLPESGRTMTLRVSNGVAEDVRTVFVTPLVITVQGDVFVNWRADVTPNPNPNPLQSLSEAAFAYRVQSATNVPALFDLDVNIINSTVPVPPNFLNSIEFFTDDGSAIENRRLELGRSETRNITARIREIPESFENQSFTLVISASSGNLTNSDTRTFTVGTPTPPPDPNITVHRTGWEVYDNATGEVDTDPSNGFLDGSIIRLRRGKQMILMFDVEISLPANYDLTIEPRSGTTLEGWTFGLVSTLPTITGSAFAQFRVIPGAAAVSTGALVFRIKRQGATVEWSSEFGVRLLT
jgi:hypothetical protein